MEHSVVLEVDKCRGCTTCLHNCPTKAIRVRNGKAMILADKCIECGECIRVCPYHAKIAQTDELSSVKSYPYKVALIPPTLIAQFHQQYEIGDILLAIEQLGFDLAVEVAYGAEIAGKALDIHLKKHQGHAYISSACPAVVKLIQERFPLLDRLHIRFKSTGSDYGGVREGTVRKRTGFEKGRHWFVFYYTLCC